MGPISGPAAGTKIELQGTLLGSAMEKSSWLSRRLHVTIWSFPGAKTHFCVSRAHPCPDQDSTLGEEALDCSFECCSPKNIQITAHTSISGPTPHCVKRRSWNKRQKAIVRKSVFPSLGCFPLPVHTEKWEKTVSLSTPLLYRTWQTEQTQTK